MNSEVLIGHNQIQKKYSNLVLTIGNFDGLHLGHQEIIKSVVKTAKKNNGTSAVYTFRPHPKAVLAPEKKLKFLTTYDEKIELIKALGVDLVIEEPFGREFSSMNAEDFFKNIVITKLSAKTIFVGYDFGFGKDRVGSLELLKKYCEQNKIELKIFDALKVNNETCSSSKIRNLIESGDVKSSKDFLGRTYALHGSIIHGDRRGGKIGFHTANLDLKEDGVKIIPKNGVYLTKTTIYSKDGEQKEVNGVTNVGVRPTFYENTELLVPTIETHLLNFNENIYGMRVKVSFIDRLRDEKKFSGVEELISQIKKDVEQAKAFFSQ